MLPTVQLTSQGSGDLNADLDESSPTRSPLWMRVHTGHFSPEDEVLGGKSGKGWHDRSPSPASSLNLAGRFTFLTQSLQE